MKITIEANSLEELKEILECIIAKESSQSVDMERNDLDADIVTLPITVMAVNILRNHGVNTIRDLLTKSDVQLLNMKNFGRKCLKDVRQALELTKCK